MTEPNAESREAARSRLVRTLYDAWDEWGDECASEAMVANYDAALIDECAKVACSALATNLGGLTVSHPWFSLRAPQEAVIAALAKLKATEVSE